jgi:drug/metabolite transporter (DMT)-like permease
VAAVGHPLRDYVPIALAVLLWAWGTPVYKYLQNEGCDVWTMTFYRTLSAALTLSVWTAWRRRKELRVALAEPGRYLLLGLLHVLGLFAAIAGTFDTTATLSTLITRTTILLTLLFSAFLFVDERRLMARPRFLAGLAASTVGLAGLCVSRGETGGWQFTAGAGLLLLCALAWATYSVAVKGFLAGRDATVATLWVFSVATLVSLPAMLLWGQPRWIVAAPWPAVLVALISGPLLMSLGESLYSISFRRAGLAPTTVGTLLVPFLTQVVSWPLLGEQPSAALAGFGVLLLAGLGLILHARAGLLAQAAEEAKRTAAAPRTKAPRSETNAEPEPPEAVGYP